MLCIFRKVEESMPIGQTWKIYTYIHTYKQQFKHLEMKRIIVTGIKSKLNTKEEKISDPEDRAIEVIQNTRQRKKMRQ